MNLQLVLIALFIKDLLQFISSVRMIKQQSKKTYGSKLYLKKERLKTLTMIPDHFLEQVLSANLSQKSNIILKMTH